jgi:cardiolipin synthase
MQLLVGGAATFDAIAEAVSAARHHVHLEYYIYEPDQTGTALRDLLIEKARAGVQVRLLVDALGSRSWGESFWSRCSRPGRRCCAFTTPR